MPHPVKYLGKPLFTVNAKAEQRRQLAEAMAQFGTIPPAPECHTKPTPAQLRVDRYQLQSR